MAQAAYPNRREDVPNPYAAPSADFGELWGAGDPKLETIRRAYLTEESYIKALVRWSLVPTVLSATQACYFLSYPVRFALGKINAPWVSEPIWVAVFALVIALPFLGILGAYGLHRRKRWALHIELLFVVGLLIFWVLPLFGRHSTPAPASEYILGWTYSLLMTMPFLNLIEIRNSLVLKNDYLRVMNATSYIRVKPELPRSHKLIMVALGLLLLALVCLSSS
jgi:hypothetical protein